MKHIKLLSSLLLTSSATVLPIVAITSCSHSENVTIEDKVYIANMGGIGVYNLNFKQSIVYDEVNSKYSIPLISITNLKAYDEDNNEVFLPYGGDYLIPAYTYNETNKVVVSVVPSDSCSSFLKYINRFSFNFDIRWVETNDISLAQYTLPSWSQTIDNCQLNYIPKISIRNKKCYLTRGDTKLTLYFTLHTKIEYNQNLRVTTDPKVSGLAVSPIGGSTYIGNGYVQTEFSVTYNKLEDLYDAGFDVTFECLDNNKATIWTQTITGFTVDVLANKFDIIKHSPPIKPSASAIVAAGDAGLDYSFDLYMYEDYDSFDAKIYIESIQSDPYIKSITFKKYDYVYDETEKRHKLTVTINIVSAMEIGYGKACWFRLRVEPKNLGWDNVLQLTMVCSE